MRQALKDVRKVFGGDDDPSRPPRDDMVAAVRKFLRQRQVESFTQLKYVCYGVTVPLDDGDRLIDRSTLFQQLLDLVQSRQAQAKQFRRCYQGLLAAYFGFEHVSGAAAVAGQNWLKLRGYLDDKLVPVATAARSRGRAPEWLDALIEHRNLLTDKPCERYAKALRAGDRTELEGVCAGLDISPTSWVWHEAVMAYVHEVVRADDQPFQAELPQVLMVVDGDRHGHQLPVFVARDAVALSVARYALCSEKPEQPELRDACLRRVGNPWLERPAWDASVKSEPARQMVESWLKRRLIKDFFELLAHDGGADVRRLNYWLKWEPQISDMWFVLGSNARRNKTVPFVALRERMAGRDRRLVGATDDGNNAFVMRIGPLLVIEFGQTGNACYVFDVDDFKTDLARMNLDIRELKQRLHARRLSHLSSWESRFDLELGFSTKVSRGNAARRPDKADDEARRLSELRDVFRKYNQPEVRPPEPGVQNPPPGSGVVWPAYSPPAKIADLDNAVAVPTSREAETLAFNPRELQLGQLEAMRFRCRRYGVDFEEAASGRTRAWVHLRNPASAPEVASLAQSMGFLFVAGKGFYADKAAPSGPLEAWEASIPSSSPVSQVTTTTTTATVTATATATATATGTATATSKLELQARQIELLKKLCEVDGVTMDDNRSKGGVLWVRLAGMPASTSLVALLKRLEFRLAPGKGYYLSRDD